MIEDRRSNNVLCSQLDDAGSLENAVSTLIGLYPYCGPDTFWRLSGEHKYLLPLGESDPNSFPSIFQCLTELGELKSQATPALRV